MYIYTDSSIELESLLNRIDVENVLLNTIGHTGLTPSLEHFSVSIGFDISEEGIVNWAVDKVKAVIHKFHIFANEAWAQVSNANQATQDSIRRAAEESKQFKKDVRSVFSPRKIYITVS